MKKFITLITTKLFPALTGLCGFAGDSAKTIASIETMTLTLQGMRGASVYKIANDGGKAELTRFRKVYSKGEDFLELEASASCDTKDLIELMNNCGVFRWDGFHGKHPKNVMDGIMFNFTATVNAGQNIHADGSENFPKGYRDFVRELDKMLAQYNDRISVGDVTPEKIAADSIPCSSEKKAHHMKLHADPFEKIKSGEKTIELRLYDEKRQQIKEGDAIIFTNTATGEKLTATVKKLHRFASFEELYKALPLLQCGYTAEDIDNASPADMAQYYSAEEQEKYGVVGIELC